MKFTIIDEIKRIRGGYAPKCDAWYYRILYDFLTLISVIVVHIKRFLDGTRKPHLRYKCPECGNESEDSQVVFNCIYDHEYNKGDGGK